MMQHIDSASEELAWELQQEKPDVFRIRWLVEDGGADVAGVLARINMKPEDLKRRPTLRPLGLQKYMKQ